MKKSNIFISFLAIAIITGMFLVNADLKKEYTKIDLKDPFKNYLSIDHESYSVLDISGSNGYPIQIIQKDTNNIKILRSRLNHFKSELRNDTMFVKFTGSNIPMNQRHNSSTPYGIIIENSELTKIVSTNTHNRIFDFSNTNLQISLKGNSFMEVNNCNINTLQINLENTSYIDFIINNKADSLDLIMKDKSIASLQKMSFNKINHSLKDSVTIVLSKDAFNTILK
ncbi:MAG: hypothetical protein ACPGUU_04260 [Flavobacteriaceae bacterium]